MANPENKQIPYESTQKDIRDAIESVATAIGGIAIPSADHVSYDNSVSELSATDVQNAIDELASEKVDKEVDKGLSTNDYTDAEKAKLAGIEANAEVNVQSDWNQSDNTKDDYIKNKPSSEVKSATDTFTTVNGGLLSKCQINLVPNQDLHGYDNPWVGGAGKNKAIVDINNIKSIQNQSGSWSGNTYTLNGVSFSVLTDTDGNIKGVKTSGTANADTIFFFISRINGASVSIPQNSYLFNGCPSNGSATTYCLRFQATRDNALYSYGFDVGSGVSGEVLSTDRLQIVIFVANGTNVDDKVFQPMIRLSTESDPTFEPYSNICPISGHTEVDLYNVGKNRLPFHIDNVKSNNLGGTWSGNIYTYKNVNWIFDVDADGYIQKVTANGLASAESSITVLINDYIKADTLFKYNGVPTGGGSSTYQAFIRGGGYDRGSGNAITPTQANIDNDYYWYRIAIANGYNAQNVVFYPMIYVGDDATYEPYLGHLYQVQIGSTVYGGYVDLVSGNGTDGYSEIASYNGETINEPWISDRDVYVPNTSPTIGAQVVYPKTTATAISTTPQQIETLVGQNNLSTPLDGQSIDSVEYREVFAFDDVEKVVSLRVPISMLGTDESGRTTASQAYASGDYFYKDGYMCKALTSISAGATLTLNTNYSQGTLADVLKAIENA